MAVAVPDILAKIVDQKRQVVAELLPQRAEWERKAAARPPVRDFRAALEKNPPSIIAEVKKASPSKGIFTGDFRPVDIAKSYEQGGAAALSVLTDKDFFQGSLADLVAARAAVQIPVLRKDFMIDEVQIFEAAAHGADAILLIAAILTADEMRRFRECAARFGMASIVEVHDAAELAPALESGADIVGVNNRNLHTFETKLETSFQLAEKIPSGILKIAESGIGSAEEVRALSAAGFKAFLVGESLMKSGDSAAALRALRS
ncbi:MAG: indole-3-glycerol phosphate synthase TrpC [Bryobacteraceae bacterium]